MPNGGYSRHLLLRLSPEFELHIQEDQVTLVNREPVPDSSWKMIWTQLGALDSRQVQALLYHLTYWGGDSTKEERTRIKFNGTWVRPQYGHSGCLYDY